MARCRFCQLDGVTLVNAHIIPRSFFKIVRGKGKYSVGMQVKRGSLKTPYFQAGVSDKTILCEKCEEKFGEWDDYGREVLSVKRKEADAVKGSDGQTIAFAIKDLKYGVFILFLLSVLWRASVSSGQFYRGVNLGPYEERIRDLLWNKKAPPAEDYAVLLGTCIDHDYAKAILRPERYRQYGLNFYRLFFPYCFAYIKVDQRPRDSLIGQAILQPRETNFIFCFPFAASPYVHVFSGVKELIRTGKKDGWIK